MISPRLARTYFAVQAIAIAAWWVLLAARAPARSLFRAAGAPDSTLLAFAPGDLLLTLGSAVIALGADGRRLWPGPLAWLVAGATAYGAMYTLALALGGAVAPLGALPLDCPNELVVSGPYAYVRNPMAIAGLGQGAAIAVWLGSWIVVAYVAGGIVAWQWVLRPVEERDLAQRFGRAYEEYRKAVRCWLPRLTPFRPAA